MPKSKFSPAERVDAVLRWLSGKEDQKTIAKSLGIAQPSFSQWIRNYESVGIEAFTSRKHRKYPRELKLAAVRDYLSGNFSQNKICKKYGILATSELQGWIMRYNSHGDFKQLYTGGAITMIKGRKTTLEERIDIVSYFISNNKDYGKTISQYGVSYSQIYGWIKRYERDGADGLIDRRGKRKDESVMTEIEKLHARLKLKEAENRQLQIENDVLKKLEELERGRSRN